jgi:circadian clock protein KaiC
MEADKKQLQIDKLETGIPGFDVIARGGLPKCRTTLLTGTAGSGKTVFAVQFLAEGIRGHQQNGVFVTFEEPPSDICRNFINQGWDIPKWEAEGRWAFVDVSPRPGQQLVQAGKFDLSALLARIENAVKGVGASRVSLDSLGAIFAQVADRSTLRSELFRITSTLKNMGVTAVLTAERDREGGPLTKCGIEEFIADNVVVMRNLLEKERRRRTLEILKFRGAVHEKGEHPFTIIPGQGIVVIPLSSIELKQTSSDIRIASGNSMLDEMCGGGYFSDSIVMVGGPTGTGKTLMTTEFIRGGVGAGDRCLMLGYEESRDEIFRNAARWGVDLRGMADRETVRVECQYPEVMALEDHLVGIRTLITEFKPDRVVIDSLSAIRRVSTAKSFREFTVGLTAHLKRLDIAAMFTTTTPTLTGPPSTTETEISTIADSIVVLRYVEVHGEMRRGITILKMQGSDHDKDIREYTIDASGMHIGEPFKNISGILTGYTYNLLPTELDRVGALFRGTGSGQN